MLQVNEGVLDSPRRHTSSSSSPVFAIDVALPPSSPVPLDADEIRNRYKILRKLGEGHFAIVQLVEDRITCETFAMKSFRKVNWL